MTTEKRTPGLDVRPNGSLRLKYRHEGRQQSVVVRDRGQAERLHRYFKRFGTWASDDPGLAAWLGREAAPVVAVRTPTVAEAYDAMMARPRQAGGTADVYANAKARLVPLHRRRCAEVTHDDVVATFETMTQPNGKRYAESTQVTTARTLAATLLAHGGDPSVVKPYNAQSFERTREPFPLRLDQMRDLTVLADDYGIGMLVHLLTDTGLRIGEALGTRREHAVHLGTDYAALWVREQMPHRVARSTTGDLSGARLKTRRGKRDIPLAPALADRIEGRPGGLLVHHAGAPMLYRMAETRLGKLNARAVREGIIPVAVHFHDFRYSWGAHCLQQGIDLVTVSRLMGHSTVTVTGDIYGLVTAEGIDRVRSAFK